MNILSRCIAWLVCRPLLMVMVMCLCVGCRKDDAPRVVLYTSVDQPVAAPIVAEFERRTGIKVDVLTDAEATKSAGLAARLLAEKANPQADVWWGNEVFHTINLAENGVLAPYESPSTAEIPARFKDPGRRWSGSCLRARVLAQFTGGALEKEAAGAALDGVESLLDPRLKGRIAIARPTAGTTGGHVAALYVLWGEAKADAYFRQLRDNGVKVVGGNSVVADRVGMGDVWLGLTDNDDVSAAQKAGGQVRMVLPDQAPGGQGTLTIPCTVGLAAGARHPDAAKKLIDYLAGREVEQKLIDAGFGRYSVWGEGEPIKVMNVDYRTVARALPRAVDSATAILEGRK